MNYIKPTREWMDKNDYRVESRAVNGLGGKGYRNMASDVLQRYYRRKELSKDKEENQRLYDAGELFRKDYEYSGIEVIASSSYGHASRGSYFYRENPSDRREFCRKRFNEACKSLGPIKNEVMKCICDNQAVGVENMALLRRGLEELARFYRV